MKWYVFIITFIILIAITSNWIVSQRAKKLKNNQIIDIIHDHICEAPKWTSDLLVFTPVVILFCLGSGDSIRWFVLLLASVLLLRSIFIQLTVLPSLDKKCNPDPFFRLSGHCNDYMFSGHTAFAILSSLFLVEQHIISIHAAIVYNVFVAFFVSATRNHYTADTVMAWIICGFMYLIYKTRHCNI